MELLNKYRAFVIFTKYHNIDQQSIVKAAEYFELKYCEKGSYLFHEGDKSNYFYGIMSGRISMRHNIEVVKTILKTLDKPESLITYVSDRKGHDLRYAIDPTKIETKLGWKPKYNFESGIKETIEWYMNNQEWMDDVTSGDYLKYYEQMYK